VFWFEGATIISCQLNGSPWIRSTTKYGGVECRGDTITVWADHDLSSGVATSFKSGLSTSQMMVVDAAASSPEKLFFALDMTITIIVDGQTMSADIRLGQGEHWPTRNWWIAGSGCTLSDKTLECITHTSGTTLRFKRTGGNNSAYITARVA
jgi:hypothetical protein